MPNPKVETVTVGQTTYDIHDKDLETLSASELAEVKAAFAVTTPAPVILHANPTGTIISLMGKTAPDGYLACDGTVYNIVDYPTLAAYFAVQFEAADYFGGDADNDGTFAMPDLRGEFLRGTGTNSHENQGSGANVGAHQDGTEHVDFRYDSSNKWVGGFARANSGANLGANKTDSSVDAVSELCLLAGASIDTNPSWTQNRMITYTSRPTNTSVLYCIKT